MEYAVSVLGIRNIILCGHYHCGAMYSLMRLDNLGENLLELAGKGDVLEVDRLEPQAEFLRRRGGQGE